jgi:outer membrane protein OmpA-like peptidoglycan-associated protein
MKAIPVAIALALASAACTVPTTRSNRQELSVPLMPPVVLRESTSTPPADARDFTYQLLNPQQTGLAQVFDDGRQTFLSFAVAAPVGLMIFDENGKALAFSTVGRTAVIDAVRRGWLIRTPTLSSYAQAREPPRGTLLEANGAAGEAGAVLPAELAAARAEVLAMQQRLSGLSAALEDASHGSATQPLETIKSEIEEIQTQLDGVNAILVRAHFASGSALLVLSETTRQALIDAANEARSVRIRGGADSTGTAALNSRVALARANNLRRVLIEGGVDSEKVSTGVAIDEFVASNATTVGRAANRRVEVLFVNAASAMNSPRQSVIPGARLAGIADTVGIPLVEPTTEH